MFKTLTLKYLKPAAAAAVNPANSSINAKVKLIIQQWH